MTADAESYENETDPEGCDNGEMVDIGHAQVLSDVSLHSTIGYPESKLYALVLTPTRELAMQVHRHLTSAAKYTGIKVSRSLIQADRTSTQRYRVSL
jgi:superfamily II DNA/RNA helicase